MNDSIDFKQISNQLQQRAENILTDICPGGKRIGKYYHAGTTQGGQGKSFFFDLEKGSWIDKATDEKGGDIIALYAHNFKTAQLTALKQLQEKYLGSNQNKINYPTSPPKEPVTFLKNPPKDAQPPELTGYHSRFVYTDEQGSPIFYVFRRNLPNGKKLFHPFSFTDKQEWKSGFFDGPRPIYNLQELTENPDKKVLIVEGEGKADIAKEFLTKYVVTTWHGGTSSFKYYDWSPLKDREVLLWPDHDKHTKKGSEELKPYAEQPGIMAMRGLSIHLKPVCNTIKLIDVGIDPTKKDGWDAGDAFTDDGWSVTDFIQWAKPLVQVIQETKEIQPEPMSAKEYHKQMSLKYETYDTGFYFTYEDEKGNEVQKPDYDGLATFFKEEIKLKCGEALRYIFDGKKYSFVDDLGLKNLVNKYLKKNISANAVSGFANKAQIICYSDLSQIDFESGFLNCNNGVLDVVNRRLLPHSDERFFKYVLDHDYDPQATCPTFLNSLNLITKGDKDLQKLIQQVFGYCIEGGHPKAEKFFVFLGSGGNGKSTVLNALRNLIGLSNISNIPVSLLDRPFSAISLDGKLANLSDETPRFSKNGEILKNIVTGGYIRAAHKGMDEIDLKCNARLIFACNKAPNFGDDSDGMTRRIVAIPFGHKIEDKEADRNIGDKIKVEMSGILNWALDGLNDLIENDYKFITPDSVLESNENLRRETDSAYDFMKEYLDFLAGENGEKVYELRSDIFAAYNHHCMKSNLHAISAKAFGEKLNQYITNERKITNLEPLDRKFTVCLGGETKKVVTRIRMTYKMPTFYGDFDEKK